MALLTGAPAPDESMKRSLAVAAVVVAVAAVAWLGASRKRVAPLPELLPYQALVRAADAEVFGLIRTQLRAAEKQRGTEGKWPTRFVVDDPRLTWTLRAQQLYVNYLGVPADPSQPRWLVLIIEPPPTGIRDPAPPEDEEHHTLLDGTALHVTIWSAPNQGPVPEVVLPFPAAEGWTQRLSGR